MDHYSMYEEWFGKFTSDEDDPKPEEVQALKDFLGGATSAQVAAAKFTAIVSDEKDPADGLYRIWDLVCDAAREIPRSQDRLLELLATIRQLPDVKCKMSGSAGSMDSIVWKDMPILGWVLRDSWNYVDPPPSDKDRDEVRQQWININAFAAKLTATHVTDLKLWAIWAFRDALEDEPWNWSFNPEEIDEARREAKLYGRTINILDGLVPAAAQWIFHAGHLVFQCQEEYRPGARTGDPARGGDLWKGKHGFCKERWQLWKTRFQWVTGAQELREETRAGAQEAVNMMEKVEKDVVNL